LRNFDSDTAYTIDSASRNRSENSTGFFPKPQGGDPAKPKIYSDFRALLLHPGHFGPSTPKVSHNCLGSAGQFAMFPPMFVINTMKLNGKYLSTRRQDFFPQIVPAGPSEQ
jgi:hypothetical protein